MEEKTPEQRKAERYAKVRKTMLERWGPDYYKKIGSKGAKNGRNRPFRDRPGLASIAGKKSAIVRRGNSQNKATN